LLTLNLFLISKYSLGGSFLVTLQEVKSIKTNPGRMNANGILLFKTKGVAMKKQK